jgi:hypothetical protein
MEKALGHYLGTEIDGQWWRRYAGAGFFARGIGEYWLDGSGLSFLRILLKIPLVIPFASMRSVKLGTFHSGRWNLGRPVVKIEWEQDRQLLSSGFVVANDWPRAQAFAQLLCSQAKIPFVPSH